MRCSGFYHLPRGYFSTHDPLSSVSFLFLWPNSADNGSADTVVGKITALHFSSVSLFPPYLFGKKGGRDDFFFPLKKRGENWGNGAFDGGRKVPVVKYSFLISEKTLVRKAGMKRWEGE